MFTDERRSVVCERIQEHGIRAFRDRLSPVVLAEAARRAGLMIVKCPLNIGMLVWLGVSSAWNTGLDFATILGETLRVLEDQPTFEKSALGRERKNARRRRAPKSQHSPRGGGRTLVSEEAFCKARLRMPLAFWSSLIVVLCEIFLQKHLARVTFRGFRVLAIDGTEIDLPHGKTLPTAFGRAKNKSGQHKAPARMVMLPLAFARLPYRYELVPLSTGEITVARRLTAHLQRDDLVLLDAGFWSDGLLCDIPRRGAFFAMRWKSGLKLRPGKRLGHGDRLMSWTPLDTRGQWKKEELPPSMDLRVVSYQVPGFRTQQLVTNVLDPERISRADWTRLTTECDPDGRLLPGLFHRRREIETTYCELKVKQGLEVSLRSRTAAGIQYEVASPVVLYLLVRWLLVEAGARQQIDPLRLSFQHALNELQLIRHALTTASPHWAATLVSRLLDRIASHVVPHRPGRHYERRKKSSNYKRKSNAARNQVKTNKKS